MTKKKLALFGSSGGIGTELYKYLGSNVEYDIYRISSKDVDITNPEEVRNFFDTKDIDIVVNLVGKNVDGFIHKLSEDTIRDMVEVNVIGTFNLLRYAIPGMRKRSYGRIILMSSVLSDTVVPGTSLYSGSKSLIDNLARVVSSENISKGITCNSIQLGYFDAGMCHRIDPDIQKKIKDNIGLGRWGKISELYKTIEYLIGNEYVTGQNIRIDGGFKGI